MYDTGTNAWANEVWVYPAWDGLGSLFGPPSIVNAFGWAHSTALGSNTGWTVGEDFNYDIGVVALDRAAGFLTGWFGWSYNSNCAFATTTAYSSGSYPAESCSATLHTGADMYFWNGSFNICPDTNRLGLFTPLHGCLGAVWGGMSGSGAYYMDAAANRLMHAVTSTSDRFSYAEYTRQWQGWVEYLNGTFDPLSAQGAAFNLQPLHVGGAITASAGQTLSGLTHVAANTSTASRNANFTFSVYLSSNDDVDASDTFLGTQVYDWTFAGVSAATISMAPVTIPANTPPGTYYLGVVYDNATDGNPADNDSDGWDALRITVVSGGVADLSVSALSGPANMNPGESFVMSNTVVNNGAAASGPFRLGLYLSTRQRLHDGRHADRQPRPLGGRRRVEHHGHARVDSARHAAGCDVHLRDRGRSGGGRRVEREQQHTVNAVSILSAVPVITLKVNGQHPTPPNVTTAGQ